MFKCYISFITGMMLGFELAENEEAKFLVIDLLIIQFLFEWDNK
jgi:hypothetical protein